MRRHEVVTCGNRRRRTAKAVVRPVPPLLTRVRKSVPDSEDRRNRAGLRCVAGRCPDGFPDARHRPPCARSRCASPARDRDLAGTLALPPGLSGPRCWSAARVRSTATPTPRSWPSTPRPDHRPADRPEHHDGLERLRRAGATSRRRPRAPSGLPKPTPPLPDRCRVGPMAAPGSDKRRKRQPRHEERAAAAGVGWPDSLLSGSGSPAVSRQPETPAG
jgi:hypothetical protein